MSLSSGNLVDVSPLARHGGRPSDSLVQVGEFKRHPGVGSAQVHSFFLVFYAEQ